MKGLRTTIGLPAAASAALLAFANSAAPAQAWPQKPGRLIVPFAAGSAGTLPAVS
jgi:tripartite-type tricarboxylate transporter receptor subunit TctC